MTGVHSVAVRGLPSPVYAGKNDHVADWQPPSGRRLTSEDLHAAVERLRKISALTEGLPGDSPNDARLRDRLELAADVLDATGEPDQERPE